MYVTARAKARGQNTTKCAYNYVNFNPLPSFESFDLPQRSLILYETFK